MLTSGQCRVAAYLTDGAVLCLKCGQERIGFDEDEFINDYINERAEMLENDDQPTYTQEQQWRDEARELVTQRMEELSLRELIQYDLDSWELEPGESLNCDQCGEELIEAYPEEPEQTEEAEEMNEWARQYDELNGAPESEEDR